MLVVRQSHFHGLFSSLISVAVTIDPKELEASVTDLLHDKLSMNAFNATSQAENVSKHISPGQNSTSQCEVHLSAIAKLCVENMILRNKLDTALQAVQASTNQPSDSTSVESLMQTKHPKPDNFENFHVVFCAQDRVSYYRDVPRMFQGDLISDHLRGQHGLPKNLMNFLDENPEIIFTVTKIYSCACIGGRSYHGIVGYKDGKLVEDSPLAEPENVQIALSKRVRDIIKSILKSNAQVFKGYSDVYRQAWCPKPYRFFFNHNMTLLDIATSSDMSESDRSCIETLCNWFETNYRKDWDEARELMSRGKINPKHYTKLFGPDELYVNKARNDDPDVLEIFKSKEYPWTEPLDRSMDDYGWDFNGRFFKRDYYLTLRGFPQPVVSEETEVDITSLRFYPLRYAEPGTKEKLVARGHKFWNYRTRSLVCHREFGEAPILVQVRDMPPRNNTRTRTCTDGKHHFRRRSDSWWTTQCFAGSIRRRQYSDWPKMTLVRKQ